jgi:hypothetical protein
MQRLVKKPGKFAAAALAAAALLANSSRSTEAQQVVIPLPQEAPKVPNPDQNVIMRQGRVTTTRNGIFNQAPAGLLVPGQLQPGLDREQLERQILKDLRPTFQRELRLLTSAAGPTPSQRREIAIEAARTLKPYIRSAAENNQINRVRLDTSVNDYTKLVRTHLELAVWSKLSNVQSARYRTELDRKELARREVVVLNVVANIDRHLRLDAAQREKLCEALRSNWDDRDYPMFETMIPYESYVPSIPNQAILFILNEDQRKVWRGLLKVHLSAVRGTDPFDDILAGLADDEPDEDVKAAFDEEAKR